MCARGVTSHLFFSLLQKTSESLRPTPSGPCPPALALLSLSCAKLFSSSNFSTSRCHAIVPTVLPPPRPLAQQQPTTTNNSQQQHQQPTANSQQSKMESGKREDWTTPCCSTTRSGARCALCCNRRLRLTAAQMDVGDSAEYCARRRETTGYRSF